MATSNLTTPLDELGRIRSILALMWSVDWDSPFVGAQDGAEWLQGEILQSLDECITTMTKEATNG